MTQRQENKEKQEIVSSERLEYGNIQSLLAKNWSK